MLILWTLAIMLQRMGISLYYQTLRVYTCCEVFASLSYSGTAALTVQEGRMDAVSRGCDCDSMLAAPQQHLL
jgi:hypothetical protein